MRIKPVVTVKKIILCIFLVSYGSLNAQSLFVNNTDGTSSGYALNDVRRITIESPNMIVLLFNGDSFSFPISLLSNYQYNEYSVGLNEMAEILKELRVEIFPNPSESNLMMKFQLNENCKVEYSVFENSGKELKSFDIGNLTIGEHEVMIDIEDLPAGSFLLKLSRGSNIFTTKFLKH